MSFSRETWSTKSAPANRRYASPPSAGRQFGRALPAPPCSPAAVAELERVRVARSQHQYQNKQKKPHMNRLFQIMARQSAFAALTCFVLTLGFRAEGAGRIVAAFDDWTLADIGFRPADQPARFATNVAAWFTGGRPGRFLAYSTHPGYTGSQLAGAMASAGHAWTVDATGSFTLTNLLTYDGVFVGGDVADTNILIQYVEAGGNVYVFSGGTSINSQWNGFVGHFGLAFSGATSGSFDYPVASSHPIFEGVDHLYALNGDGNGSTVVDLDPSDPRNVVLVSYQGSGLFAVWDGGPPGTPVMSIRVSAMQAQQVTEVEVSWTSRTNRTYQVQSCSSLPVNVWTNLGASVPGQSVRSFITVVPDQAQRFYRVVLLP